MRAAPSLELRSSSVLPDELAQSPEPTLQPGTRLPDVRNAWETSSGEQLPSSAPPLPRSGSLREPTHHAPRNPLRWLLRAGRLCYESAYRIRRLSGRGLHDSCETRPAQSFSPKPSSSILDDALVSPALMFRFVPHDHKITHIILSIQGIYNVSLGAVSKHQQQGQAD